MQSQARAVKWLFILSAGGVKRNSKRIRMYPCLWRKRVFQQCNVLIPWVKTAMVQKGLMLIDRWKSIHALCSMGWLGKWRSNPATGKKPWNFSVKGFLNNCDDILKWELESVQWIDTQELSTWAFASLSFILMQSSTNPETAEPSISRFVLRIVHRASLYLQIGLQPWGEVSLAAQNSCCRVQQTETDYCFATDRDVLLVQGSLQTSGCCMSFPETVPTVLKFFSLMLFLRN